MIIQNFNTENRVFIVAEIGNNHEGNLDIALELIDKAAACGADAVKFQTFNPTRYVSEVSDPERVKKLETFRLSFADFKRLKEEADSKGLVFFSTPFDLESARFLNEIQSVFKISSGDNNFQALLSLIAGFKKNMIISTGLSTDQDVDSIYRQVKNVWSRTNNQTKTIPELSFLHCVSSYPVPHKQANLNAITTLRNRFPDVVIGYSDHVAGIESGLGAVALGARILEKHFTLDKNYSDFRDHQLSSDPEEFSSLITAVRKIESMLGDGKKVIQPCEIDLTTAARRSVAACRELEAGHIVLDSDLTWVRPGTGFSCGEEAGLIGKKLSRPMAEGQIFHREDIATS